MSDSPQRRNVQGEVIQAIARSDGANVPDPSLARTEKVGLDLLVAAVENKANDELRETQEIVSAASRATPPPRGGPLGSPAASLTLKPPAPRGGDAAVAAPSPVAVVLDGELWQQLERALGDPAQV